MNNKIVVDEIVEEFIIKFSDHITADTPWGVQQIEDQMRDCLTRMFNSIIFYPGSIQMNYANLKKMLLIVWLSNYGPFLNQNLPKTQT